MKYTLITLLTALVLGACNTSPKAEINGELKKWHKVTLLFSGPESDELAAVNPFLDYRLDVTFTNGDERIVLPGFYAADGNAAETSAESGNKWMVRFTPTKTGEWFYVVSFKKGENISVDDDPSNAASGKHMDGEKGSFTITDSDKSGRDNRAKGLLDYVGEHHLRFRETGEFFIKQGADSPENLLAYSDFDNTPNYKNYRRDWAPHMQDWQPGDPTWKGDKGKGLIGGINYLASEGMNAFSFLTYNVAGDDRNVFPMISDDKADRIRYDCSKLDQWEVLFDHGDKMGMYMHFKLQERENDGGHATENMEVALDSGNLGVERKLYIRELVARFSHHLAMNWNLGEENEQTTEQLKNMAHYIHTLDPYKHNIVVHTTPGTSKKRAVYTPLLGDNSDLTGASLQGGINDYTDIYPMVYEWVTKSAAAGKKWVVANDEQAKGSHGILPDSVAGESQDIARKRVIWGTIMAGGAGSEYYFGYKFAESDLKCQNFRSRDKWWDYARYALQFFEKSSAPFWEMSADTTLVTGAHSWCLAKTGSDYIIFLPYGGTSTLNTGSTNGTFEVKWYNPRSGGELLDGSVKTILGGKGGHSIGFPPIEKDRDWVCYVRMGG